MHTSKPTDYTLSKCLLAPDQGQCRGSVNNLRASLRASLLYKPTNSTAAFHYQVMASIIHVWLGTQWALLILKIVEDNFSDMQACKEVFFFVLQMACLCVLSVQFSFSYNLSKITCRSSAEYTKTFESFIFNLTSRSVPIKTLLYQKENVFASRHHKNI